MLKFSLADCHTVVCVSHTSKENTVLRACVPPQRVCVIPNGAPRWEAGTRELGSQNPDLQALIPKPEA